MADTDMRFEFLLFLDEFASIFVDITFVLLLLMSVRVKGISLQVKNNIFESVHFWHVQLKKWALEFATFPIF